MSIKFLVLGGGGYFGFFFWGGECRFYFYGREGFSEPCLVVKMFDNMQREGKTSARKLLLSSGAAQ